eukprot:10516107-Alexandrium_andersonii.AAC.1
MVKRAPISMGPPAKSLKVPDASTGIFIPHSSVEHYISNTMRPTKTAEIQKTLPAGVTAGSVVFLFDCQG